MEDILFNLVPNLKDATDDFKAAVLRRYKEFVMDLQINQLYLQNFLMFLKTWNKL